MRKGITLFLALAFFVASMTNANASEQKSFDLKNLQQAVSSLTSAYSEKKIYDTDLISLSNQIIRLNKEISSGRRPNRYADIKASLKDASAILDKLNTSKLSVYAKKADAIKKDKAGITETEKRIANIKNNLDKAMVHYSVNSKEVIKIFSYPGWALPKDKELEKLKLSDCFVITITQSELRAEFYSSSSDWDKRAPELSGTRKLTPVEAKELYEFAERIAEKEVFEFDEGIDDGWDITVVYKDKFYTTNVGGEVWKFYEYLMKLAPIDITPMDLA